MVSFHASILPISTMNQDFCEESSKKRKRDGSLQQHDFLDDLLSSKTKNLKKSLQFDTELHLETPMPLEWQRCLDIKSGQIYYYNTSTHKKTSMDPRSIEPPKNNYMSLDLELNLPCGSSSSSSHNHHHHHHHHTTKNHHHVDDNFSKYKINTSNTTTSNTKISNKNVGNMPSWLALEGSSGDQQQQEMMTAVCKKCHMLVMMFKSSPSCPNCKFMHPPNQTPPNLFTRELSLLC